LRDELRLRLRHDAVTWRPVGDEVVALDVRQSTYLGLNTTGAFLWKTLDEGATRWDLVRLVCEEFDADREQVERDVDAFLADLTSRGLVEEVEG
jgi:hypothetical protein